jgi:N-acetylmuramoyl-L-alanine amidase
MRRRLYSTRRASAWVGCAAALLTFVACGRTTTIVSRSTGDRPPPVAVGTLPPPVAIAARSAPARAPAGTKVPEGSVPPLQRPVIEQDPLPFPDSRKREMTLYAKRHYGIDTYRLISPRVIVEHYTETPDFQSTYEIFAPDHPDSELHELPNTCAHFVVDRSGTIHQLVPVAIMCRHTVGLNYTAIGIENVGYGDREILEDHAEMRASLALTRWLRCKYRISIANVVGHNESLGSPYHHEDIPSLRTQTHEDWRQADMSVYRARLRRLPCP